MCNYMLFCNVQLCGAYVKKVPLPGPGRIVIKCVCGLVGWFIHLFLTVVV